MTTCNLPTPMKLENGDAFEVTYAGWLREHLPSYEPVWAAFIGHGGTGWPCAMVGLDDEGELDRKRFYQAHYSFAVTMHRLLRLSGTLAESLSSVPDFSSLEAAQERLFLYAAYLGHVRDMFKTMDEALECHGTLYSQLQEFYAQRSHVIHGPSLPVRLEDGLLKLPKIGGANKLCGEWDDKSTWDSMAAGSFQFASDLVEGITKDLVQLVCVLHAKVFNAADQRFGGRRVANPTPIGANSGTMISGRLQAPAISASVPLSGQFRG